MPNPDGTPTLAEIKAAEQRKRDGKATPEDIAFLDAARKARSTEQDRWNAGTPTQADVQALHARRTAWAEQSQNGGIGPSYNDSQDQNTSDVNTENAYNAKAKAGQDSARLSNNYADQGRGGGIAAYAGSDGKLHYQEAGLKGMQNSLSDPNSGTSLAYQYGGRIGGADAASGRYQGMAASADQRGAIQADYGQSDQSRGAQYDALGLYRDAAMGRGPSAAQAQFQQGLDRSMAANMSLANSARGGSLGLAQGRLAAMGQNSAMLSSGNAQAAQLRAQEMQQAMSGYAGLGGQIRNADIGAADAQARLAFDSRTANDARAMGLEQLGFGVSKTQLDAQMGRVGAQLTANGAAAQADAQKAALAQQGKQNSRDNTSRDAATAATIAVGVAAPVLSYWGGQANNKPSPGASGGSSETNGGGGTSAGEDLSNSGAGSTVGGVNSAGMRPTLSGGGGGVPLPAPAPEPRPPRPTGFTPSNVARPYRRYW